VLTPQLKTSETSAKHNSSENAYLNAYLDFENLPTPQNSRTNISIIYLILNELLWPTQQESNLRPSA
jgi:hypothetical protein